MRSGNPDASDELKVIIETKKHVPCTTVSVVSEAARWLKACLKGADAHFNYASCEEKNHYGYATLTIIRRYAGEPVCLDLKIAEIRDTPFIFAEVRTLGKYQGSMFPFFGEMRSEDGRSLLLHYIADFLLSTD